MKKIITIFLILSLSMALSVCGFADDLSEFDCKNFSSLFDADEYVEVISEIKDDHFTKEINSLENDTLTPYNIKNYNEAVAYKMYDITSSDFIGRLSEGAKISELIPENYSWIIPGENTVAKVIPDGENKWRTVGYKTITQHDANDVVKNDVVKFDEVNSAVESIRLNDPSEITDIICINAVEYFTNFVCITLTDKTYLIPFGSRPDFTGLDNGTLYSPEEVRVILEQTMGSAFDDIDEINDIANMQIGGVGHPIETPIEASTESKNNNIPWLPIIIVPAVVIAVVITVSVLVWNNSSKQKRKK